MNLFEKFLYEDSNNEEVPDAGMGEDTSAPPDIPDDMNEMTDEPPDLPEDENLGDLSSSPPDMNMDDQEDAFMDDGDSMEDMEDDEASNTDVNLGLDEKISAIMNKSLFQKFLSLLSKIHNQLSSIEKNGDIFYTLSKDSLDIINALNRLDENIHLYLENKFMNEDYGINFLFFNKCLNLWKLLNDKFDKQIHKGIKDTK